MRIEGVLLLSIDGEKVPIDAGAFERSRVLAGVPTKLTFQDGSVFEAKSNSTLTRVLAFKPSLFDHIAVLERTKKIVFAAGLITLLLIGSIWRWGLPAFSKVAAWATPNSMTELMDRGTLQTLDQLLLAPSKLSENQKLAIRSDFQTLENVAGETSGRLVIHFRDAPTLGANAFALPGGSIILTDQLVEFARNSDEIAGVLAHEIGHVKHRHPLRQLYQALGASFLISLIGGDPGNIVDSVIQQASALQTLAYSRDFEQEADLESAELMHQLNRDPFAMIDVIERITRQQPIENETSFISTHPGNKDRRESIERLLHGIAQSR